MLGVTPAVILATCRELGIGVASPQSMLDHREVDALRDRLTGKRPRQGSTPGARRQSPPERSGATRIAQHLAWLVLVEHKTRGTPVEGRVTAVVKGGLVVDVGVRGFMPASQVDTDWVDDLQAFVGTAIAATVIELDEERKSVVLSRREVLERRRRDRAVELPDELAGGEECDAVVVKTSARGLLVRVDDALEVWIPSAEMPDSARTHQIGDNLRITVCDLAEDRALGSLRLASESNVSNIDAKLVALGRASEQSQGLLQVVDGRLTAVIDEGMDVEPVLSEAVESALACGAETLCIVASGSAKRRVRAALQDGNVVGVHPRRSRQTSTGFHLALRGD